MNMNQASFKRPVLRYLFLESTFTRSDQHKQHTADHPREIDSPDLDLSYCDTTRPLRMTVLTCRKVRVRSMYGAF